jgi:hypothetical protein
MARVTEKISRFVCLVYDVNLVEFKVLTAVAVKDVIFLDVVSCGPYIKNVSERHITSIFRAENQPRKK